MKPIWRRIDSKWNISWKIIVSSSSWTVRYQRRKWDEPLDRLVSSPRRALAARKLPPRSHWPRDRPLRSAPVSLAVMRSLWKLRVVEKKKNTKTDANRERERERESHIHSVHVVTLFYLVRFSWYGYWSCWIMSEWSVFVWIVVIFRVVLGFTEKENVYIVFVDGKWEPKRSSTPTARETL